MSFFLRTLQAAPPQETPPLIVKLIEPPTDPTGLAEVFIGVVRLTGVWVLVAVALGAALAYALFWYRSRSES